MQVFLNVLRSFLRTLAVNSTLAAEAYYSGPHENFGMTGKVIKRFSTLEEAQVGHTCRLSRIEG